TNDLTKAQNLKASLAPELQNNYIYAANFFGPEIGEILAKATLIVSRAGANTVSEIIALDKYALLVPIPWSSHNEQQLNAEFASQKGNAEILGQREGLQPQDLFAAIIKALEKAQEHKSVNKQGANEAVEKIF